VYLPAGGTARLDLTSVSGDFSLTWFNPRDGGPLSPPEKIPAGGKTVLTAPSADDWLAVLRR